MQSVPGAGSSGRQASGAGTGGTLSTGGGAGTVPTSGGATGGSAGSSTASGGVAPAAGGGAGNGAGGVVGGAGGATAGAGGTAGAVEGAGTGAGGTAGSSAAGSAGAPIAGTGGSGGAPGSGCPASATFCSDFEGAGIPTGAAFMPSYQAAMWSDFMSIDATTAHGGSHSLMVKPTGNDGYSYRALAVTAPAASFWVRLYVKSDVDLGQSEHNAFFGASTADGDQNNGDLMEVAEQYCQVVMNLHDDVVTSVGGTMACGAGVLLTKNVWHCAEAFFDGPNGHIQVFSDGDAVIDKSGWTKLTYKSFVFGFIEFHGPSRTMWYDDVAVGPERMGCP